LHWVCKQCGRSMKAEEKPNWCYFDRCDSIENVRDEDSVKMGLSIPEGEIFEFPGDVRWDPMSGEPAPVSIRFKHETGELIVDGKTLKDFQNGIMEMVRK